MQAKSTPFDRFGIIVSILPDNFKPLLISYIWETPCKPMSAGRLIFVFNFRVLETLSKVRAKFGHKFVDPVANGF
jgi:hypothetical protein